MALLAQSLTEIWVPNDGPDAPGSNSSRVIVRFRGPDFSLPDAASSRALGIANLAVVGLPPGLSVSAAVRHYKANPNVLYVEPDYDVSITATPTDPLWNQQWDMEKIAAPAAWDLQTSATNVIAAVIDTGVDFNHSDLRDNLWINPADGSHGFTCMNGECVPGGQDDQGHGTHVAGTIGAVANNGIGIAGINWRTQILACKFLGSNGSGSTSDAILCFEQILSLKQQGYNIRVTNNSWGGGGFSQALKDAMAAVESQGIVNVCAAGNSSVNADLTPMYPGAFDNRGIISVLASDQNDSGAYFTNYGVASVDIAAPGVSVLSTVPTGSCSLCDSSGYRPASGTSMAAPHVTGVVTAMFQANPSLTAAEARDVLLDPSSYDLLLDQKAGMTSTGGRLNLLKAITSPLLTDPVLNNFPVVGGNQNVFANAGDSVTLTTAASDPDGDPLRIVWENPGFSTSSHWLMSWGLGQVFPDPTGESLFFEAPSLAREATAPYALSVSDGKGGSTEDISYVTVLPGSDPGQPPSGNLFVSPLTGPVGTVVSVDFQASDPEGGPVPWDLWVSGWRGASGLCCHTEPYSIQINAAGAYRISTQAMDAELQVSERHSTVVHIGGATGTPPIADAQFDKLSGSAPLTVNIDMRSSIDPDGSLQGYTIICDYGTGGYVYAGPVGSCVYDTPGTYWMMLKVKDNEGLTDLVSAYAVVTPPEPVPSPTKSPASVFLGNLTQTYTGNPLTPSVTTDPPGLPVLWTNAPKTNAGTYTVTASVSDPDYEGSASAIFTISKAPATVILSDLTPAYTGTALSPTVTTNPPGLPTVLINAPQVSPGAYSVTATITDPNHEGSSSGTFTIASVAPATVVLSDLTQTYTGRPLTPIAVTNPPGLPITWTNAPQTDSGTYSVTATVDHPSYQGSATGTFTINKAAASVTLSKLEQSYTGGPLTPTARTSPPQLAISWINAPKTEPGAYAVIARVDDPNYEGQASGTFTITGDALSSNPPSVSITGPASGPVDKGSLTIEAAATPGDNPIARVDILIDGSVRCSIAAAPYTCSWNVPGAKNKSYQLQAQAYDTTGGMGVSSIVTVTH